MNYLGLLGGMSWESTAHYYASINRHIRNHQGGLHSGRILLHSFDFETIAALQRQNNWQQAAELLGQAGQGLAKAGAGVLVICTNTMHKVANQVTELSGIPLLHITNPTINALQKAAIERVGLLGTRFTMEDQFYTERLVKAGFEVLTPNSTERTQIHNIIFDELCQGKVLEHSQTNYLTIIERLKAQGAEAVILGCTEIAMLLETVKHESVLPLFDTTELHAKAAADWLIAHA